MKKLKCLASGVTNKQYSMKQYFTKIIAVGLLFLLGTQGLFAQKKRYEIMLHGSGGLSSLKYSVNIGKQTDGFGGQAGLGYGFFFVPKWGLRTGVEFSLYRASFTLKDASLNYMTTDMENVPFEFRCKVNNYKEKQYLIMLQIPLMIQFQTGIHHQFYMAAGGKIGIPLSMKYNGSNTIIYNSGYYDFENYEYTTQQFMGFGQFPGSKGNLDYKPISFIASVETGAKWMMREGYKFYTGIYLDYGLNNIINQPSPPLPFLDYNTTHPADFTVNSIIKSQYAKDNDFKVFTNKIIPLSAGIKLMLAF